MLNCWEIAHNSSELVFGMWVQIKSKLSMTINSSITALHLSVSMFLSSDPEEIYTTHLFHEVLVVCFKRSKVKATRVLRSFDVCAPWILIIWRIRFILGLNTTREVTICLPLFSGLKFRGQDRVFSSFKCVRVCAVHSMATCQFDHGHVPIWPANFDHHLH